MSVIYTLIALLMLGGSTSGMSTNATLFQLFTTVHNLTGSVMGWSVIVLVIGIIAAAISGARDHEGLAGCFLGCFVAIPALVLFGTVTMWIFSGGLVNTFSPEVGPTSALFWAWIVLSYTVGLI